jgi:hypothetical protein
MQPADFKCVSFSNGSPPKSGPVAFLAKFRSIYLKNYKGYDFSDCIFEIYRKNTPTVEIFSGVGPLFQNVWSFKDGRS